MNRRYLTWLLGTPGLLEVVAIAMEEACHHLSSKTPQTASWHTPLRSDFFRYISLSQSRSVCLGWGHCGPRSQLEATWSWCYDTVGMIHGSTSELPGRTICS
jgi:hypothetical protein